MSPASPPDLGEAWLDREGEAAKGNAASASNAEGKEMTKTALTVDDLFDDVAPAPNGTAVPSPGTNVLSFPAPKALRLQDIVLNLLMDGEDYDSIGRSVGRSPEDVQKIARSEWAKKEIARRLSESSDESQRDTLQNLVRIQAFDAVHKLGALLKCGNPHIELKACQLALQYSLPLPSKMIKDEKGAAGLPTSAEALREEFERNSREIARHLNPNSHIE